MQSAIILGAMATIRFGNAAPLVIVIALETLIDFVTRLASMFEVKPATT